MQKNTAAKTGSMPLLPLAVLLLLAFSLLFAPGCVQYTASVEQKFVENGIAYLTVHERLHIDETLVGEYATTIQNDSESKIGKALVSGIIAYYNTGQYAKDLCNRANGVECKFTNEGEVIWNTTLKPDGRFYTYHSENDWLRMDRVTKYEITRVPMLHFFAYNQKTPDQTAAIEWGGLHRFLEAYLKDAAGDDKKAQAQVDAMLDEAGPLKKSIDRYAPLRVPEQIVDFGAGQIRSRNYDARDTGAVKSYNANLSYVVQTYEPIKKADMGGVSIVPEGERQLRVTIDGTHAAPKGKLVIETKKSFSPLGVYTWIIPLIGIIFTLAREVLLGSKKIWKNK